MQKYLVMSKKSSTFALAFEKQGYLGVSEQSLIFGESGGTEDFNDGLSSVHVRGRRTRGRLAQLV